MLPKSEGPKDAEARRSRRGIDNRGGFRIVKCGAERVPQAIAHLVLSNLINPVNETMDMAIQNNDLFPSPTREDTPDYTNDQKTVTLHTTATLQKDGSSGKQFWVGRVIEVNGRPAYQTESWRTLKDGSDSKHRVSDPTFTEAKNVGRSNETTPLEQAISEIDAKAEKKKDKRYWPVGEAKPDFLAMPMKGKVYGILKDGKFVAKRGPGKVDFPAAAQPKLDGMRMMFDGEKGWTRKLKVLDAEIITHMIDPGYFKRVIEYDNVILDGELILPTQHYTFQETISAAKAAKESSTQLQFWMFDAYFPDEPHLPYEERSKRLKDIHHSLGGRYWMDNLNYDANGDDRFSLYAFKLVETRTVSSHEEVMQAHAEFVGEGHEGTMIRTLSSTYKDSTTRSSDLLKLKGFFDDEFTITGFRDGDGKHAGAVVFICETDDGQEFEVTPKGDYNRRRKMYENGSTYIGKPLTVRYQGLTDDGKPRFPVGVEVRDYEGV